MRRNIFGCIIAGTAAITALTFRPDPARACNENGYIGSICWTTINFCPDGYLPADGRRLPLPGNAALFSVVRFTYSPGSSNEYFYLPDMRGYEPISFGTGPGLSPVFLGSAIGSLDQTYVSPLALPEHDHGVTITVTSNIDVKVQSGPGTERTPAGNVLAAPQSSGTLLYADTANGEMVSGVVTANIAGATVQSSQTPQKPNVPQTISVVGPQLGMRACINVNGVYPPIP
ncbi:phage tail protein [Thalassospira sp. TSL5-1]|uniref:phage tail protein n=1 Tax=Thalassospira sp. TSL5-1 TaxID=1544451 RepID=UPI00093A8A2F|nr:tail fiber protein [Thalassospira sp. TSL5-1]